MGKPTLQRRKTLTAVVALTVVAAMVGLTFASPPLYRLVCTAIGIGGATRVATEAPAGMSNETVTVRFDANVSPELPWTFTPTQKSVTMKFGEPVMISYHAKNTSDHTTVGAATFNVTPEKAGPYFDKLQCFCFQEQTLAPGQEADLWVKFFVDPALLKDRTADEVREITLSYTFFRALNGLPVQDDAAAATSAARTAQATAN